ncbi:MAG: sulfatase-like hydrolase/transferase [Verrucomicrobia bacterium]|nr:sulfatase-like hydrolase/transferase [Verrucomicrobiota bacterium]MBT7700816.1 sulfatase-like hydrolase/transferase [Verrucomicrobiota bacterium]
MITLIVILAVSTSAYAKSKAPNFIVILSDDQGWSGTSVAMDPANPQSKSDYFETPHLERLAKRGMRFSNAYAPAAMCSATRFSLQFGQSTARTQKSNNYDADWEETSRRMASSLSIPQMLKAANKGYVCAHLGKWHMKSPPEELGYDVTTGHTGNRQGTLLAPRTETTKAVPLPADDPKRIFSLTKKANDFMAKEVKAGRPFYMQVSHYAVHVKLMSLANTQKKYEAKKAGRFHHRPDFGACTEDLDTGVGLLIDKIDELGIADNTYIFYTADNGAVAIRRGADQVNMPLRRGKFIFWEGGIRVPFLVAGPGIPANQHSSALVSGIDIWGTIHDIITHSKPVPKNVDAGSLKPLWLAKGRGEVKRPNMPEGLIFHCDRGKGWSGTRRQDAIRSGDYKLLRNHYNNGETLLFDVKDDLYEWKDLSEKMPGKTKELAAKLDGYLKRVKATNAAMTQEEVHAMQNIPPEGFGGYSQPLKTGKATEYPVNSFPKNEDPAIFNATSQ